MSELLPFPGNPTQVSAATAELESIVVRFEQAWQRGERPVLDAFLPTERAVRRAILVELVHTDLERRLKAGEPVRVEEYLTRYDDLAAEPRTVLDLVVAEYRLRVRQDATLSVAEYQRRFPALGEELAFRLREQPPRPPSATPPPTPADQKVAGETEWPQVPGYLIEAKLGQGGRGVVYRARDLALKRTIALKMLPSEVYPEPEDLARFRREAEVLARLQHPNIVQIHEVGEQGQRPYFAMEFCPGGSLDRKLQGKPLPAAEAARLVDVLARAVEAAHEAGVIHRDLKPGNVLLQADGTPKVADFGLARKLDEVSQTLSRVIVGTPSYMAPEQALGRREAVGPACDVWALGAILYECLTGRPPFLAETAMDTVLQVLREEPVAPRQLNATVPRDLETICLKCLRKQADRRYASAQALALDLGRFRKGEPIAARPVGQAERLLRWCRRNPALAAALGAVAVSLVLGTGVALAFAVRADRHADAEARAREAAQNNEQAAKRQEANAVAAREEVEKTNDRLRSSVARNRLRPLALQAHPNQLLAPPLSDPEIEALSELAQDPDELLPLRFVREALRSPSTVRQLRFRAAVALQAAVALDRRRHDAVERLLAERLADKSLPWEQRTDLALSLAALGDLEPQDAQEAAAALIPALNKMSHPDASSLLVPGLEALADRLGPDEARDAAAALVDALSREKLQPTVPARGVATLAARLDLPGARQIAAALLRDLGKATLPRIRQAQVQALAAVAARLDAPEATAGCDQAATILVQALGQATGPSDPELLARGVEVLAPRLSPPVAKLAATALTQALILTTGPFAGDTLAAALGAVLARLSTPEVRQVAALLVQAIGKTTRPETVYALMQGLDMAVARLDVPEAAEIRNQAAAALLQVMTQTADPFMLETLSRHLVFVASRLGPQDAREVAAALLKILSRTTNAVALKALALSLKAVATRLSPPEAAATCAPAAMVLLDAAARTTDPGALLALAWGVEALTTPLSPREAAATCSQTATQITQAMGKTTDRVALQSLAWGLGAVANHLEARDAKGLAAFLTEAMNKTTSADVLEGLVQGLKALAARMPPEDAAATCSQAATFLTEAMGKTTDPRALAALARGLGAVANRLKPPEATAVCGQVGTILIQALGKTTDYNVLSLLLASLTAVADPLNPQQIREEMAALTQIMNQTKAPGALVMLGQGRGSLAGHLEPSEAAVTVSEFMSTTSDPATLQTLVLELAKVADRLDAATAGKAASFLTQALGKTTNPSVVQLLAQGLQAVAPHLSPVDAKEAAAVLAQALHQTTNPSAQQVVARGLGAVAARLEPREAGVYCGPAALVLLPALIRAGDTPTGGDPPVMGLRAVLTREPTDRRGLRLQCVSRLASLGASPSSCSSLTPIVLGPALEVPPELLPVPLLVDLLKQPLCVGEARRLVLDLLGVRYGRSFADHWAFVRFAAEQDLGLDFTGPPLQLTLPARGPEE